MLRRVSFGIVACLAAAAVLLSAPAKASKLSELLFGGVRVYTTAGITAVVEGYLRPELGSDPSNFLSFWALKSDQTGVQASADRLQGGVVIPRGSMVKIKIYIEPGNADYDREVVVQQYAMPSGLIKEAKTSDAFGLLELARFRGVYQEIVLDTMNRLFLGTNAIRVFMAEKGKNRPAYLGVGIVVTPRPEDVKRQADLVQEEGLGEYLQPQDPVKVAPAAGNGSGFAAPDPEPTIPTGTVVIVTNAPGKIRLLSDNKEVVTRDIRDRRVFDNVPTGAVTVQIANDGAKWTVRQDLPLRLEAGKTVTINIERRSAR